MGIWYCRREDVQRALDSEATARTNSQIDRQIEATSRDLERFLHRKFYPQAATRRFDWPDDQMGRSWRLWLNQHEVYSLSSVTANGTVIAPADYYLEPVNDGPPYNRLEIDLTSSSAFDTGSTHQRDIVLAGIFAGADVVDDSIGSLSADLAASESATASVTFTSAEFGVGDLLLIGSERAVITAKTMVDSTQNLGANLTASNSDVTVPVSNGAAFAVDVVLLIDSERMLVVDIAGNNLTVKRAWDGSVLAAHTSPADIYTLTGVELTRAQVGTALAAHLSGATIYQWQVPGPVRQLCIAEVLNTFEQERSAYARTVGSGDNERNASGAGIADQRKRVYRSHGRKARLAVV
jgi:hypothetical protein